MSLSRSPSPAPGGGWASPGLNINSSGRSSPAKGFTGSSGTPVMWESARLKSGYPSFSTQNQGFFTRHMRKLSSSLPRFSASSHYAEKEKLGRGQPTPGAVPLLGRLRALAARMGRKLKIRLLIAFLFFFALILFYNTREWPFLPQSLVSPNLGTDSKFSSDSSLAEGFISRRRAKVRGNVGRQCRRRRHGMEGREGMGDRAGLGPQ